MNTTNITADDLNAMRKQLADRGWVTCPHCGWMGLQVTKAGQLRKHGRAQTGRSGRNCPGSGTQVIAKGAEMYGPRRMTYAEMVDAGIAAAR